MNRYEQGVPTPETLTITYEGRPMQVRNRLSLEEYATQLNRQVPGTEVLAITRVFDYPYLPGQSAYPAATVFTDGVIEGVLEEGIFSRLVIKGEPTYLAWFSPQPEIPEELSAKYKRTAEGKFYTHHLKTHLSIDEIRRRIKKVPDNTVKVSTDIKFSNFLRAEEKRRRSEKEIPVILEEPERLLDQLVEDSLRRYSQVTFVNKEGKTEGYLSIHAAEDAVKASGEIPDELFSEITGEATVAPSEALKLFLGSAEEDLRITENNNWDWVKTELSIITLHRQIVELHPEIKEEDERRAAL